MLRPIRLFGDPVLRTPAEPVVDFDLELRNLVRDLTETMMDAPGVGLAAPPKTNVQDLPSIVTVEVVGYETTERTPGTPEDRKKERKGK